MPAAFFFLVPRHPSPWHNRLNQGSSFLSTHRASEMCEGSSGTPGHSLYPAREECLTPLLPEVLRDGLAAGAGRTKPDMIISFIGRGLGKGGCFSQDPQTSQPLEDGVPAAFPLFSAAFLAKAGAVLRSRGQKTPSGGVPTLYQLMSGLNWKMLPPKAGDFEDLRDFQEFLLAWNNSQKGTDEEGRPLWTSHFCHRGPNPQMPTLHSPCTLVSLPHAVHRFLEAARALISKIM